MIPLNLSASNSSKSGDAQGGQISGGTAFNIGGINLGTQYPTAVDAGGGSPMPFSSFGGGNFEWYALAGVVALGAIIVLFRHHR